MKKFFPLLTALLFSSMAFTQADYATIQSFQSGKGKFTIYHYAENIYKIKFEPVDYKTGEHVSDAVIMKVPPMAAYPMIVANHGDTILLEGRPVITGIRDNNGNRGFIFPLAGDEKIFGAGERALPLNRRGYLLNLYNNPWYGYGEGADNLNYSVPFITSSKGYGLFFDNPSKSYLDIGKTRNDILEYGASSGELNVFVIFGNYQQVLESYYRLTGTQPLPPRWAFGNLMSRFGYISEAQATDILSKMRAQQIPVDAIIFDLFWFGDSIKHSLGNLDWINHKAWPDPKKMIAGFNEKGVHTILVTEPFFVETSANYKASKPFLAVDSANKPYYLTDFYFGMGGLVDIFRNDAQQWFWKFYKKQMDIGVSGWWGDLGEPEKHPSNLYHNLRDYGYHRLFRADEVHNLYGHTWTKMLFNHYAKDFPEKRLFSLNRSGFAGSQRYDIFPWTGDVSRSWSGYRAQLPLLLGMCMSGVPYVHSDAGGFAGGEGDNELYVRWLQFAAFTPIFRPHGTALYEKDPNAFSFPSEAALIDSPYREIAKDIIAMRYRFLPYNYSLAYGQAKYGKPLMAPLYYYFSGDTAAVNISDEYMWGEKVLVVPVLEKGAASRKFYLPPGNWYENETAGFLKGGQWHNENVTLSDFPLFYKEGAFIVTDVSSLKNTRHYQADSLSVLYVISDRPSSFDLYNDDGNSKEAIGKKQFEVINFSTQGKMGNSLEITIRSNQGNYPGKKLNKFLLLKIAQQDGKPVKVVVNGISKPCINGDSDERLIKLSLGFASNYAKIQIVW